MSLCWIAECLYAECIYVECIYAECLDYAQCLYAKFRYAGYLYAECRSASIPPSADKNLREFHKHLICDTNEGSLIRQSEIVMEKQLSTNNIFQKVQKSLKGFQKKSFKNPGLQFTKRLMNFLQTFNEHFFKIVQTSCERLTNCLWTSWHLHTDFLFTSNKICMTFLQALYELLTNF
jgi:hypothetical protein